MNKYFFKKTTYSRICVKQVHTQVCAVPQPSPHVSRAQKGRPALCKDEPLCKHQAPSVAGASPGCGAACPAVPSAAPGGSP